MNDLDQRVANLEQRLKRLEEVLLQPPPGPTPATHSDFVIEPLPPRRPPRPQPAPTSAPHKSSFSVTALLGWAGIAAVVLAAAYLIKLGVELGWLTPTRQVVMAVIGGLGLIGGGLALRNADREYAGYLPAGGIAILFLAVYGAHLYYRLIPGNLATLAVVGICLGSLALCRVFRNDLYALFAVAGSYSAPLLLSGIRSSIVELALYYTAWSIVFCLFSLWVGHRLVYLLALYLALIGFDLVWQTMWHNVATAPWEAAVGFQTIQFLIFVTTTTVFSIRRQSPLDVPQSWAHLPPLLLFYVLQYSLLNRYLPLWAPWIAVGSAALVLFCYVMARQRLGGTMAGGRLLLSSYLALVLFHAGYLEGIDYRWQPWAGLALVILLAIYAVAYHRLPPLGKPVFGVLILIFTLNLLRLVAQADLDSVPASQMLVILYAVQLYAAYALARRNDFDRRLQMVLAYCGHIAAMAAAVHLFESPLAVSVSWGLLALACLAWALWRQDRIIGQSSLLVFGVSAGKVLLHDLSEAKPLIRIACLLVLGATCYVGGWLYKRMSDNDTST